MTLKNRSLSTITTFVLMCLLIANIASAQSPSASPSSTPTPTPSVSPTPSSSPSVLASVSLGAAPTVSSSAAIMYGIVNSNGDSNVVNRGFEIGTVTGTYTMIANEVSASGLPAGSFSISKSFLTCNTRYFYRAYATNTAGKSNTSESSFITSACATPTPTPSASATPTPTPTPSASGSPSTSPTPTPTPSPTSSASASPSASPTPTPTPTPSVSASPSASATPTPTPSPTSSASASPTPSIVPVLAPLAVSSSVTKNSAVLSGTVNSGPVTARGFEYGTSTAYGALTSQSTSATGAYSLTINGLTPGTLYHFRSYAANANGSSYSSDATFVTKASPSNLTGWAWSSNIGWLKLDDISVDQNTGNMIGYAWSPNIGWVKFDGLSGYPANGSSGVPANINFNTGEIKGWIRACAGTVGGDCSSMVSRTDGWDGWIELAGSNHVSVDITTPSPSPSNSPISHNIYNVANALTTFYTGLAMDTVTGKVSGMAWGGPVVGWLNFNADTIVIPFNASCSATDLGNGVVKFTAVPSGGSGNYQYQWNNGVGAGTSLSTYSKTYIPNGPAVTVNLKVREAGQVSFLSPLCTFTPKPSGPIIIDTDPNPACIVSPTKAITGKPVTFSVTGNPQPAGDTFTYAWYPDNGDNQAPSLLKNRTYTYASSSKSFGRPNGYIVQVGIADTTNTNKTAITRSCGTVEVTDPSLDLYIGADSTGAKANTVLKNGYPFYQTKVGRAFTLVLDNTLEMYNPITEPQGYTCTKTTTYTPGNNNWRDLNENQLSSTLSMNASVVGEYNFIISCESQKVGNAPKSQTAILKVTSPTEKEI